MAQEISDFADIRVPECTLESEGLFSKKPVFSVQVSSTQGRNANGSFRCRRTLKDLYKLRGRFSRKWPGLLVPVLPAKRLLAAYISSFSLERLRKRVEIFLRLASQVQELCIAEEFLMFLSPAVDNFAAVLKTVAVPEVSAVLVNYQLMIGKECPPVSASMLVTLAEAKIVLYGVKARLEEVRKAAKAAGKAYRAYRDGFKGFTTVALEVEYGPVAGCSDGEWTGIYPEDLEFEEMDAYRSVKDWTLQQLTAVETALEAITARESLELLKSTHIATIEHLRSDLTRLKYSESPSSWLHPKPKFEKVAEAGDKLEQVRTI